MRVPIELFNIILRKCDDETLVNCMRVSKPALEIVETIREKQLKECDDFYDCCENSHYLRLTNIFKKTIKWWDIFEVACIFDDYKIAKYCHYKLLESDERPRHVRYYSHTNNIDVQKLYLSYICDENYPYVGMIINIFGYDNDLKIEMKLAICRIIFDIFTLEKIKAKMDRKDMECLIENIICNDEIIKQKSISFLKERGFFCENIVKKIVSSINTRKSSEKMSFVKFLIDNDLFVDNAHLLESKYKNDLETKKTIETCLKIDRHCRINYKNITDLVTMREITDFCSCGRSALNHMGCD